MNSPRRPILVRPDMLVGDHEIKYYFEIEKNLSYFPPFTIVALILNLLVFFWAGVTFIMNPSDNLILEGRFQGAWILDQPMRVYTANFLHAGVLHLFGNMSLLYIAGIMLEHLYGTLRLVIFYVASCFVAMFTSYFFYESHEGTLGASGAVFALMGLLLAFFLLYHSHIFIRNRAVIVIFCLFTVQTIGQGFFSSYINNAAHVGGFVFGLLVGFLMKPYFKSGRLDKIGNPRVEVWEKRSSLVAIQLFILTTLVPFYMMQSRLSPWGNISFWDNFQNYIYFLLDPPNVGQGPSNYWVLFPKKPTKIEHSNQPPGAGACEDPHHPKGAHKHDSKGNAVDSEKQGGLESVAGDGDKKKTPEEYDRDKLQAQGEEEQGRDCPVCVKGSSKPCLCDSKCRWTYLHHYSDENCKVKILTNVWGPNTGSPFKMGFKKGHCVNYIDRSFSWDSAHSGCFAPTDQKQ